MHGTHSRGVEGQRLQRHCVGEERALRLRVVPSAGCPRPRSFAHAPATPTGAALSWARATGNEERLPCVGMSGRRPRLGPASVLVFIRYFDLMNSQHASAQTHAPGSCTTPTSHRTHTPLHTRARGHGHAHRNPTTFPPSPGAYPSQGGPADGARPTRLCPRGPREQLQGQGQGQGQRPCHLGLWRWMSLVLLAQQDRAPPYSLGWSGDRGRGPRRGRGRGARGRWRRGAAGAGVASSRGTTGGPLKTSTIPCGQTTMRRWVRRAGGAAGSTWGAGGCC